ncbi:major facilitator superfamily transporter [Grosmannia clavigera kw1407]|uniref:Major facilitator superfamily transporter n=1 Tax=Grosmannia clavigera (strain kw1407 / UAMH 11150) TaxID=655863 RepID=F0XNM4_GROCL|nr:major facilitator superfamily transporter [Grosmannia clavigera kw1407]EFX00406.1 major facilitator superfamily transporter [Grosmannia clavigera kw1407]
MADTPLPVVPGTVHLVDVAGQLSSAHAKGDIELIPRPSDDPEDPLNWSDRRKRLSAAMMVVYTLGTGFASTFHYSLLADITIDTGISTASLVQGSGLTFLFLGWACLLWQPVALTFGRRGVYLGSTLAMIPMMVWSAYIHSLGEWYATRILIGIFLSPIESLPEVSVPDVFFAHNRGAWMGLYVFILFGSNFLGPLVAGWFGLAYGWRWCMKFGAMVVALTLVILFFFLEETMYVRTTLEGLEQPDDQPLSDGPLFVDDEKNPSAAVAASKDPELAAVPFQPRQTTHSFAAKKDYLQKLAPFVNLPGRPSVEDMFIAMYTPLLILLRFPSVVWAGFIYGINLSWYNVMNGTASPVLSAAPYNWSSGLVGSIYIGPIVGAAVGCLWAGVVADRITLWLARRNGGIREPEQRLWPLALSSILSCVGLITWGVGAAHQVNWSGLAIALGILTFSVVTGGSIALSYNVDSFKDISGESTTGIIIVRNTLGFGISYAITPWYTNMGLQNCFIMAGFLSLGCTLTFLLMIWKGKELRRWSAPRYWKMAE